MVQETSKVAYRDPVSSFEDTQIDSIWVLMRKNTSVTWSISEVAYSLHMEKSTVSARMNMMKKLKKLEFAGKRKSRITNVLVETWRLKLQESLL